MMPNTKSIHHHNPLEISSSSSRSVYSSATTSSYHSHHLGTNSRENDGGEYHGHLSTSQTLSMVNNKFTNFHSFILNSQARLDLMNYLRRRQNDENITFVDDVIVMRESIRKVIRMFMYEMKLMNSGNHTPSSRKNSVAQRDSFEVGAGDD